MNRSNQKLIELFSGISGKENVLAFSDDIAQYGADQTINFQFVFDILIKPSTPEEISDILRVCNNYKIPVTPRGGGSGVTGGALPVRGGVVLSLERLNKVISINKSDGYVIAESGVVASELCTYVKNAGFYYPASPSSSTYSFIGGNVAENAGSINSCRYGTTAQYVLNLEVVLPTGEIIWTGANLQKNATGLNLTQLFVGSEGILGIITKVVYKLIKKPKYEVSILAAFRSLEAACTLITLIKQSDILPSALELICDNALQITAAYLKSPPYLTEYKIKAQLLINLTDNHEGLLNESVEEITAIIEGYTDEDILLAYTIPEKERLWQLRFNIGAALTHGNKNYRDIDICVPVSALYSYITTVETISTKYEVAIACFGHALDGNLHTMLNVRQFRRNQNDLKIKKAITEIYAYAISIGGVISGEHGIGFLQKEFMPLQFSKPHLNLMKSIKLLFDPNEILNPDKIF